MLSGLGPRVADRWITIAWFGTTTPRQSADEAWCNHSVEEKRLIRVDGKVHFVADGSNTQRSVMRYDLNMRTSAA